ncbi:stage 0 sporulation family protein [Candidatus Chloroploca sp. Khr17]|uniref:PSP1 domain-containing protein n=1 Tax=Candidatus Chloroploca sp. Khr17 TaxID=2496869 RepID=UPI00101CC596|nr:stage 0 sporulation family protein [Candidatus Chloroploca sp. Khr17]
MPIVIGIRFKDSGKVYYFDPQEFELQVGEPVIVETVRGLELARVAYERREVPASEIVGELKPVVRRAESVDLERFRDLQARHGEVLERCAEKVREHGLPMSLVKAEYSFDGARLTFYFTAEKRVDFRLLVRDLARTFKSRIELRQIGPRDEARLLGGIGPCGRVLCCASFLPDYARVSIKMAKDQDLPLNPSKISGVCGRLLCCLSYEHEQYVAMRAELPRKGTWVQTPDGPGEVVAQQVLKQQLIVQLVGSGVQETYGMDQIELATTQVAATARARNTEGVTPVAQQRRTSTPERHDRRKLRDEIDQYDLLDDLELLEDDFESPFRDSPPAARATPRSAPSPHQAQPPVEPPRKSPRRVVSPPPPTSSAASPAEPTAETPPPSAPRRRRRRSGRGGAKPDPETQ